MKVALAANGCHVWIGALVGRYNKYGRFFDGSRNVPAHRWAYERAKGPIPAGFEIDHLCDDTRCVNPLHLEPTSPAENLRRQVERRRLAKSAA